MKKVFITGICGFIGHAAALEFKKRGWEVSGLDDFNWMIYDSTLKQDRQKNLVKNGIMVYSESLMYDIEFLLEDNKPDLVLHLAAHANVRKSVGKETEYLMNNVIGTQIVIDACENLKIDNVLYASSSSVSTGLCVPWYEKDIARHHNNTYALSKATNEEQFRNSIIKNHIGIRFFTVYGPWGRPDMAIYNFTKSIIEGKDITIFIDSEGSSLRRDFTYIDDAVDGIMLLAEEIIKCNGTADVYNIGGNKPIDVDYMVQILEMKLNKQTTVHRINNPHEAEVTFASTLKMERLGWRPKWDFEDGIEEFIKWYKEYTCTT